MHFGIDNYRDFMREIKACRDEYVYSTRKEPNTIKMSREIFDKYRIELVKDQVIWAYYDEFADCMRYRIYGMDLIFVDNAEGIEVYAE